MLTSFFTALSRLRRPDFSLLCQHSDAARVSGAATDEEQSLLVAGHLAGGVGGDCATECREEFSHSPGTNGRSFLVCTSFSSNSFPPIGKSFIHTVWWHELGG